MNILSAFQVPTFKSYAKGSMESTYGPAWVGRIFNKHTLGSRELEEAIADGQSLEKILRSKFDEVQRFVLSADYNKSRVEPQDSTSEARRELLQHLETHLPLLAEIPPAVRQAVANTLHLDGPVTFSTNAKMYFRYFDNGGGGLASYAMRSEFAELLATLRRDLPLTRKRLPLVPVPGRLGLLGDGLVQRIRELAPVDVWTNRPSEEYKFRLEIPTPNVGTLERVAAESMLQSLGTPSLEEVMQSQ